MHPVVEAFPRRRLRARAQGPVGMVLLMIVCIALFGGALPILAMEVLPDLRSDFAVRDSAVPTDLVALRKGRCRSRMALLQDCQITLAWRDGGASHTRVLHYVFVEPHIGGRDVRVVADPARPELATTDLGLERLTNRVLTFVGLTLGCLLLILGALRVLRNSWREIRLLRRLNGQEPVPVAATFEHRSRGHWRVRGTDGVAHDWPVRRNDEPFMLDAGRGLVLALAPAGGGPAFPLDTALARVRLTEEERRRILAAG